jgi:hypothetical protein
MYERLGFVKEPEQVKGVTVGGAEKKELVGAASNK